MAQLSFVFQITEYNQCPINVEKTSTAINVSTLALFGYQRKSFEVKHIYIAISVFRNLNNYVDGSC